jgi:hypothetical protein
VGGGVLGTAHAARASAVASIAKGRRVIVGFGGLPLKRRCRRTSGLKVHLQRGAVLHLEGAGAWAVLIGVGGDEVGDGVHRAQT